VAPFYNSVKVLKKKMDLRNALWSERDRAVHQILKMLDGRADLKCSEKDQVLIGFGDGKFKGSGGRFIRYVIQKLRALNYINIYLVDERHTSKYCVRCGNPIDLVEDSHMRKFVCTSTSCIEFFVHRDKSAAQNIACIVEQYFKDQTRPTYLEPTRDR
jgi:hypothetical protein